MFVCPGLTQLKRSRYLLPWASLWGWSFFLTNIYCTLFFSQLCRTKAAYSQRKIATSGKTENFVISLRKRKAYVNFFNAQHSTGDFVTAIDCLKSNLKTEEELSDRSGERTAYGSLDYAHHCLEDFNRAIDCHERRVEIVKELGDISGEGTAYGNSCNVYHHLEDSKEVKVYHESQLKIANELGDRSGDEVASHYCLIFLLLLCFYFSLSLFSCFCCFLFNIPPVILVSTVVSYFLCCFCLFLIYFTRRVGKQRNLQLGMKRKGKGR